MINQANEEENEEDENNFFHFEKHFDKGKEINNENNKNTSMTPGNSRIIKADIQNFFDEDEEDSDSLLQKITNSNKKNKKEFNEKRSIKSDINNSFNKNDIHNTSSASLKQKLNTFVNNYSALKESDYQEEAPRKIKPRNDDLQNVETFEDGMNQKKNFYQKNMEKLRREKELLNQMSKNRQPMPNTYTQNQQPTSYFNQDREINDDDNYNDKEMDIGELTKDYNTKPKYYNEMNQRENESNSVYALNSDEENSLDEKIKKLQRKKFELEAKKKAERTQGKNIQVINQTMNNTHKNLNCNKLSSPKMKRKLNTGNTFSNAPRAKSSAKFNTTKHSNKPPLTTNQRNNRTKPKNIPPPNNNLGNNNALNAPNQNSNKNAEIKNYINEINSLKMTISQLKTENEKLRNCLQRERIQNDKFRKLTEEIIKHYEQTKKI